MKSQWNVLGPQFRFGLALFAVTLTKVAVAQPDDGSAAKAASSSATGASATASASGSAATATKANSDTPAATASAAEAAPEKPEAAPPVAEAPPTPVKEAPAAPAAEAAPEPIPLNVEILPGSGYPEPKVRGIVGGSLWLTMPGLQFPYMAPETSRNQLRIAISGSVWDDTSYARINSGTPESKPSMKRWNNQARAVLRATPAYTTRDGWFAQGQLEFVANGDQTLSSTQNIGGVDDVFVRAGKWNVFDVTVGRYQGWEVYHYGMGLDQNTLERRGAERPGQTPTSPPQIYGLNYFWDRPDGGAGNYAAHVYFTDYLRLEVLGQIGTQSGANSRGVRPVAILDLGYLKVKAGVEYGLATSQDDGIKTRTERNGAGGAIQFVANPYIEGGINAAIGFVDVWNDRGLPDTRKSTTTKSYGAFLNGRVFGPLLVGLGVNNTHIEDLDPNDEVTSPRYGKVNYSTHLQSFFAVQYSFWNRLFFKFVGGYADFHFEDNRQEPPHPYSNTALSGRLRMMYLF